MFRFYLICIGMFLSSFLSAQIDTSLILNTINISEAKLPDVSESIHIQSIPSLATYLQSATQSFIKNYGDSGIATLNYRGTSAAQSQILWNEIPISNPMVGMSDLSIIPVYFIDHIEECDDNINVGTTLNLFNSIPQRNHFKAQFNLGSFSNKSVGIDVSRIKGNLSSRTRLFYQNNTNNFTYPINKDSIRIQENGAISAIAVQQEFSLLLKNSILDYTIWAQSNDRQIPPTSVQSRSEANQKDKILRQNLHWIKKRETYTHSLRLAYDYETIHYEDPLILLDAFSSFHRLYSALKTDILKPWGTLKFGITNEFNIAEIDNYSSKKHQRITRINNTLSYYKNDFSIQHFWGIQQWNHSNPFIFFDTKINQPIGANTSITIGLKRMSHIPGMNDLYWNPGGNPNLNPESSFEQYLQMDVKSNPLFQCQIDLYHRKTKDWILWAPDLNNGFFKAQNIGNVQSTGAEIVLQKSGKLKQHLTFDIDVNYSYNHTSTTEDYAPLKIEKTEQIWYNPTHSIKQNNQINLKQFSISYISRFIGKTSGINEEIDAYYLADLFVKHVYHIQNIGGDVILGVQNLWNKNYRIIERRPMKGRHFSITINTKF